MGTLSRDSSGSCYPNATRPERYDSAFRRTGARENSPPGGAVSVSWWWGHASASAGGDRPSLACNASRGVNVNRPAIPPSRTLFRCERGVRRCSVAGGHVQFSASTLGETRLRIRWPAARQARWWNPSRLARPYPCRSDSIGRCRVPLRLIIVLLALIDGVLHLWLNVALFRGNFF